MLKLMMVKWYSSGQASSDNDKTNMGRGATPHSWLESTEQNRRSSPNKEKAPSAIAYLRLGLSVLGKCVSIRMAGPLDF